MKKEYFSTADLKIFEQMGENIKLARKRRKLAAQQLAQDAGISRNTLYLIETGSPGVSMGAWFNVLRVLGFHEAFTKIASDDPVGQAMQDYHLSGR